MTYDGSDDDDGVYVDDRELRDALRRWWDRNARSVIGLGITVLVFVFWYYICTLIAWMW